MYYIRQRLRHAPSGGAMMSSLVELDGREGEGGGQVLRSALSLSLITGRPFRLEHVRAKRRPPGLKAQHLTCVKGAAAIANARVDGAELGSDTIEFHPEAVVTDPRTLDVGTAGSVPLLLQCLFYPLALAGGARLTLRGGTHVTHSPTFDYLARIWLPMVRLYGFDASFHLDLAGFFPQGGGSIRAEIHPANRSTDGEPHRFESAGRMTQAEVLSTVGGLPLDIASRQNAAASERLGRAGLRALTEVLAPSVKASRGSAVLVWAKLENGLHVGASALGDRGVRAEEVGRLAGEGLITFVEHRGSADVFLGDQLLLPAALAAAGYLGPARETSFIASEVTEHLTTHASVLQAFLDVDISIDGRAVLVAPSA